MRVTSSIARKFEPENMKDNQQPLERVRVYFLLAAFLVALPVVSNLYYGQTGKFLVASERLTDSAHFSESVIYLYSHNLWGAKGLILNKPDVEEGAFIGGPVHFSKLKAKIVDTPKSVTRWKSQELSIRPYYKDTDQGDYFRGITAWGVGQLEGEINKKLWIVLECDASKVIALAHTDMYEAVLSDEIGDFCRNKKVID